MKNEERKIIKDFLNQEELNKLAHLETLVDLAESKKELLDYEIKILEILQGGYLRAKKNFPET